MSVAKQYLRLAEDIDQKISFNDQYPLFECTDLRKITDIKYFGWMKKDDE